jgi:hypothetical protein
MACYGDSFTFTIVRYSEEQRSALGALRRTNLTPRTEPVTGMQSSLQHRKMDINQIVLVLT